MSSASADPKKRCKNCFEYVKIYITCFKCNAAYHIYCWKRVPGAYVNKSGQLFCCSSPTTTYAINTNLGTQDNLRKRVIAERNVEEYKQDFKNHPDKQQDSEWNKFKCDACHLEFMNKEYLENHYSECPNKEGEFIKEFIKEDKDFESRPIKQEDSEWNEFKCGACHLEFTDKEYLENHYTECPKKEEGFSQELKEDKDSENCLHKEEDLEWSEFRCCACLLEFMNKEHLKNHYSECPNKEGELIDELKEDKDLAIHFLKEENSEPNKRHLEDHCTESPNKQGRFVPGLSNDKAGLFYSFCNEENFQKEFYEQPTKQCHVESGPSQLNGSNNICITNAKENPPQVDNEEKEYKRTIYNYYVHIKECVVKGTRIHTNEKPFKCNMCDYASAWKADLKGHVLAKHSNADKEYKCRDCEYSTHTKGSLVRHIRIHTNEKPFKCDNCDYAAARKNNLKSHDLAKHSNADKQYKCRVCQYSTHRNAGLIIHMRTHTNVRRFKCDMCDYAAVQKANLNDHILTQHSNADKKYKCRDCQYSAHRKENLRNHIRTHTNEKPFKCEMCDYAAARKITLNFHILTQHSNADKQYKCSDCQYSTHIKQNLINHIRTHINEKPFKCDMCDYAVAQKKYLNKHVLAKHSLTNKEIGAKTANIPHLEKQI